MDTTIDHTPAVVNHTGLTRGLPWALAWAFGPAETPDNLTGKTIRVNLRGASYPLALDLLTGTASLNLSAQQTAAFTWTQAGYLLLIDNEAEVKGTLTITQQATP